MESIELKNWLPALGFRLSASGSRLPTLGFQAPENDAFGGAAL